MTVDTAHDAAKVIVHAIDISHGCHLNVTRHDPGGLFGFLSDASAYINMDDAVTAETGVMPMPVGTDHDGPDYTTVTYPDGSCIRVGWDADGFADYMAVYPHVGAEAAAVYR